MARRYHQTARDRRDESRGARRGRRYHQTSEDRRHESEGMRGHDRSRSRGTHNDAYHQTERDREDESRAMRGRHYRGSESSHGSHGSDQTREDRRHEAAGMRRYYREDDRGSSRRYHEMDSAYEGMIHEDHYAPANLPQEVRVEYYPKQRWLPEDINDTITRVDDDIDDSIRMLHEYESRTMY